jgi:hypothetical protein
MLQLIGCLNNGVAHGDIRASLTEPEKVVFSLPKTIVRSNLAVAKIRNRKNGTEKRNLIWRG